MAILEEAAVRCITWRNLLADQDVVMLIDFGRNILREFQ